MAFKTNGAGEQGFVATHIWKSQDCDWPVALTGGEWRDEATGRDFVEVVTDDGISRPIPKDELIAKPNKRTKKTASKSTQAKLSPTDAERLRSWMLEIADEALGEQHEESDGSFRFGANRALVLSANGFFYSFAADRGGTDGVDLLYTSPCYMGRYTTMATSRPCA